MLKKITVEALLARIGLAKLTALNTSSSYPLFGLYSGESPLRWANDQQIRIRCIRRKSRGTQGITLALNS